jgi:hypothetical protein
MVRAEDYQLLQDIADFRRQKLANVLSDLIQTQWDKNFPPITKPQEAPRDRPKNPFLQPHFGVDR